MCLDHHFDKLQGDTQQGVTFLIEPSSCWSCQDSAADATGWSVTWEVGTGGTLELVVRGEADRLAPAPYMTKQGWCGTTAGQPA